MTKRVRMPIDELLAKSSAGAAGRAGITCPKCACIQFSDGKNVRNTVHIPHAIRRYRVCRNCGHSWATVER
jgi:hypothetical protein